MIECREDRINDAQAIYDDLRNIRRRMDKLAASIADGVEPKEFVKLARCAADVSFRTLGTAVIQMTEAAVISNADRPTIELTAMNGLTGEIQKTHVEIQAGKS